MFNRRVRPLHGFTLVELLVVIAVGFISHFGLNTEFYDADSQHAGGVVNVAFTDGSARPVNDTIDWPTWVLLNGFADESLVPKDDLCRYMPRFFPFLDNLATF